MSKKKSRSKATVVIRTSVPKKQMSSAEAVRSYKALAEVERAFRSMKTLALHIRPIHHRLEHRVRAHIYVLDLPYSRFGLPRHIATESLLLAP